MKMFLGLLAATFLFAVDTRAQEVDASGARVPARREIVVTGNGEASANPDQAIVRLGATIQAPQADVAQAKVNEIIQAGLEAIEKLNIPKRMIKTSRLSLSPVYANQRPGPNMDVTEPKITGYRANNTIEVTLEDIGRVGKVIDAGIKAGVNELQGVSFALKSDTNEREQALRNAAQEAHRKAEVIADALKLQLGPVTEVTESGVHVMPDREYFAGARMAMAGAMQTPVQPGEIKVQASVTVHYQIMRR